VPTTGFEGTVNDAEFARLLATAGPRYLAQGSADWAVTPTGVARQVSIAAGVGRLLGVRHETTGATTVTNATNSSGSDRYDIIVWRGDWTANTVTATAITGTPGAGIPAAITKSLLTTGAVYDGPICVCKTVSGGGVYSASDIFSLVPYGGVGQIMVPQLSFISSHDQVPGQIWTDAGSGMSFRVNTAGTSLVFLGPAWAELRQTTAQTLANNTWTALNFQTEESDSIGGHSTSTNPSRFTCGALFAGTYEFSGGCAFVSNSTGVRNLRWAKNGSLVNGSGVSFPANPSPGQTILPARTKKIALAAGDYVELQAIQTSGGNLDTFVIDYTQPSMSVTFLGP
jgi:hypothetical protein